MKLIGMVGGTTWLSTAEYYRHMNVMTQKRLGGLEAAKLALWSINFGDVQRNNESGSLDGNFELVKEGCLAVESIGAKAIMLCANTMHMFADRLEPLINVPIIHIADAVGKHANEFGQRKLLLLGTKYTMSLPFYTERLQRFGIEVVVPNEEDRNRVNQTIFEEMAKDDFRDETRQWYLNLIERYASEGVDAAILGCTEIPILIEGEQAVVPMLDTGKLHCAAAVDFALSEH